MTRADHAHQHRVTVTAGHGLAQFSGSHGPAAALLKGLQVSLGTLVRGWRDLGQQGEVYFGVDGTYRTNFSSNPTPSAYTWVDGYTIANFRAGFRTDDGFNIFGWLRNAFDTEYFEQLAVPSGNTGLIVGQPGDQQTYGLTIAYNF